VRTMAQHIQTVRQLLFQKLKALGTPGNWDHIVQQNGMFCYTGLSGEFLCINVLLDQELIPYHYSSCFSSCCCWCDAAEKKA